MAGLILGMIFGAIGSGYIVYGKKTMSASFAVGGILLIVYPYFVDNAWLIVLIGIVIAAVPIALHRGWI